MLGRVWTRSLPVVDAQGTRANRIEEIAVTQTMLERVGRRFGLRPQRLAGDTVYGAVRLLKWLIDRKIAPHVPVWDKSARPDGTFSRADFAFDQERQGVRNRRLCGVNRARTAKRTMIMISAMMTASPMS